MKRNNEFRDRIRNYGENDGKKNQNYGEPHKSEERAVLRRKKRERKEKIRKIRNRIAAATLSGVLIFSGAKAFAEFIDSKNVVSLDEALKSGETLKELGINEEIKEELDSIKKDLQGANDLSNIQLQELAIRINELQGRVLRSKVADAFNVNPEEVKTGISYDKDMGVTTRVYMGEPGDEEYKSFISEDGDIFGQNSLDENFDHYIYYEDFLGDLAKSMTNGDINRSEIISKMKEMTDRVDKFSDGKVILENDKLNWEGTRQSEIEKKKEQERQEREDDNVR